MAGYYGYDPSQFAAMKINIMQSSSERIGQHAQKLGQDVGKIVEGASKAKEQDAMLRNQASQLRMAVVKGTDLLAQYDPNAAAAMEQYGLSSAINAIPPPPKKASTTEIQQYLDTMAPKANGLWVALASNEAIPTEAIGAALGMPGLTEETRKQIQTYYQGRQARQRTAAEEQRAGGLAKELTGPSPGKPLPAKPEPSQGAIVGGGGVTQAAPGQGAMPESQLVGGPQGISRPPVELGPEGAPAASQMTTTQFAAEGPARGVSQQAWKPYVESQLKQGELEQKAAKEAGIQGRFAAKHELDEQKLALDNDQFKKLLGLKWSQLKQSELMRAMDAGNELLRTNKIEDMQMQHQILDEDERMIANQIETLQSGTTSNMPVTKEQIASLKLQLKNMEDKEKTLVENIARAQMLAEKIAEVSSRKIEPPPAGAGAGAGGKKTAAQLEAEVRRNHGPGSAQPWDEQKIARYMQYARSKGMI